MASCSQTNHGNGSSNLTNSPSDSNATGSSETNTESREDMTLTNTESSTDMTLTNTESKADMTLIIKIGSQTFTVTLYDNPSVQAFMERLPLNLDMRELNGNEKYCYLPDDLPTDSISVGNIQEGDFMLYGDNCLVLFYKSFSTRYSYTPLGHIDDPEGFADAVGTGNVTVEFDHTAERES